MKTLTPEQVDRLADILDMTCREIVSGLDQMDLDDNDYDVNEIEDALMDRIERCEGCDWWHEPGQLDDGEDGEPGYCDECRKSGHGEKE